MSEPVSSVTAVERVRAWRREAGWAPYRFAVDAGVAEATLRGMDEAGWNPTLSTLQKLEALIPKDWRPGNPVPTKSKARAA